MNGCQVATLREGDKQIPIVARLRIEERAQLGDVQNLYVYSSQGDAEGAAPASISTLDYGMQTEKILRRNQFRTITVSAFPAEGVLPSEVLMRGACRRSEEFEQTLPPGYRLEIGGEEEEQDEGLRRTWRSWCCDLGRS